MELFKYILPAFLVMMTAYLMVDKMLTKEEKKLRNIKDNHRSTIVVPIRLRAYERLMLLLERTNPSTMVMQVIKPGMNCLEFQTKMLEYIRNEFEHNLAQQIYVSNDLWKAICVTRETLVKYINACAKEFDPHDQAPLLAEMLVKSYSSAENNPSLLATNILKNESKNLLFTDS